MFLLLKVNNMIEVQAGICNGAHQFHAVLNHPLGKGSLKCGWAVG